jgi:hypothetical protein
MRIARYWSKLAQDQHNAAVRTNDWSSEGCHTAIPAILGAKTEHERGVVPILKFGTRDRNRETIVCVNEVTYTHSLEVAGLPTKESPNAGTCPNDLSS